jgi:hypothetical protein
MVSSTPPATPQPLLLVAADWRAARVRRILRRGTTLGFACHADQRPDSGESFLGQPANSGFGRNEYKPGRRNHTMMVLFGLLLLTFPRIDEPQESECLLQAGHTLQAIRFQQTVEVVVRLGEAFV